MKSIPLLRVNAFTTRPAGGNPAAVVLDSSGLSDGQMRTIAREMNLSETCFLTGSNLRWFTPRNEVTFCGHGTIATAHALGQDEVTFHTLGGLLRVRREQGVYYLTPEARVIQPFAEPLEDFLALLELTSADLADWAPPAVTPEKALMLFCRGLDALRRARTSTALGDLGRRHGILGFSLTTRETVDPGSAIHSRYFAPAKGVPEDPVTGSVHASLAVYLHQLGVVPATFVAEQGDLMGRPGRLYLDANGPRVGGRAVTVLTGTLRVPRES
jgi:PhzF family phenazine biosynthesis protein